MKADDNVVAALRSVSLFRGLDDASLRSIAQQMRTYSFGTGSSVIDEQSSGKFGRLYSIVSGTAEARVNGATVATFGPGDSFGEMSVLDGQPRSAAIVATSDLKTLGLSSWNMRAILRDEPEIAMSVITELVGRLRAVDERHLPLRTSAAEVLGADVLDEVLEFVDDLRCVVVRFRNRFLTDLVDQLVRREQRRCAPDGQRDRVGRSSRDHLGASRRVEMQFGVVGAVTHLGDDHAGDRGVEFTEHVEEQVVGQRPGRLDTFERVVDRRRFGTPDVDRQQTLTTVRFAEQDHGRVGRHLHANADEFQRDHVFTVPGTRTACDVGSNPTASQGVCDRSDERIIAARSRPPVCSSSSS